MQHIERHMPPSQWTGKSFFISNEIHNVYALIKETMDRPDKIFPHRSKRNREVKQKRFTKQVGVHGISQDACYSVTVIIDVTNGEIISAFPTI